MKYAIKFLSHFLLLGAFVYIFFFQGQLGNYNFWEWCWTVVISIIGLLNFIVLIAAFNGKDEKDGEEEEKSYLRLAGFIDFLVALSIWLMGVNIHVGDETFLIFVLGLFIMSSGINKFTFSLVTFASSLWLFILFNSLSVWHSWLLFFLISRSLTILPNTKIGRLEIKSRSVVLSAKTRMRVKRAWRSSFISFFRFHAVAASMALTVEDALPHRKLSCILWSVFRCPISGSMAARRRNGLRFFAFWYGVSVLSGLLGVRIFTPRISFRPLPPRS